MMSSTHDIKPLREETLPFWGTFGHKRSLWMSIQSWGCTHTRDCYSSAGASILWLRQRGMTLLHTPPHIYSCPPGASLRFVSPSAETSTSPPTPLVGTTTCGATTWMVGMVTRHHPTSAGFLAIHIDISKWFVSLHSVENYTSNSI